MVVIGQPLPRRRRRRAWLGLFALLALLIVGLVIANAVVAVIRVFDRPGKPAPGVLLYAGSFEPDDASNADWQQEPGQASTQITAGVMLIAIDEVRSIYTLLRRDFRDLDARVNVSIREATSEYTEMGMLFRFRDAENYYMFKLRGDKAGVLDVISEWQFSPMIKLGVDQINQLRLIASDDSFQFFVNNEPMALCLKGSDRRSTWNGLASGKCLSNNQQTSISFRDATLTDGKIGLGVVADSPGVRVVFDNVLLFGPN
jgi:multisubunit Na+/H+ antiporter MnhE subunit